MLNVALGKLGALVLGEVVDKVVVPSATKPNVEVEVPIRAAPPGKGSRTIWVGALLVILPPLTEYLVNLNWTQYLGPYGFIAGTAIGGLSMIVMRAITERSGT